MKIIRPAVQPEGHYLNSAEGSIHYHDVGRGEALVLQQAFGPYPGTTVWSSWAPVLDRLRSRFRCILIDAPNWGLSGPIRFDEPFHALCTRASFAVMDHLRIDQAHVAGFSMGGTVALEMAITEGSRVKTLVVGGCHASTGGDPYVLTPFPSEVHRLYEERHSSPPDDDRTARLLRAMVFNEDLVTDDLVGRYSGWLVDAPDHFEAQRSSTSRSHSNLELLERIDARLLVIHGKQDRMVPLEQALMLTSYLSQADLVVLNRAGHWAPWDRPEDYARYMLDFLPSSA